MELPLVNTKGQLLENRLVSMKDLQMVKKMARNLVILME